MEGGLQRATLLGLPSEIRSIIWKYAFGNLDINLYHGPHALGRASPGRDSGYDCSECEECLRTSRIGRPTGWREHSWIPSLSEEYQQRFAHLLICKTIYSEAVHIFQSTAIFHVKSSETLALLRSCASPQLRQQITRIVLYVHFQDCNEMAWYLRLVELNRILPGLKHIAMNYHMQAPLSYRELADAIYMSMPLFALDPPFSRPLYVAAEYQRSEACRRIEHSQTVATIDPRPGLTIHTAYKKRDMLFSSEFLGDVSTDDVIDEHTQVIRTLFEDPDYVAAVTTFLASDTYHQPWRAYKALQIPQTVVPGEIISINGGRALYEAIEQISHQYERPWFERLQKKRVIELYMEEMAVTKEAAEARVAQMIEGMDGPPEDRYALLLHSLLRQPAED